MRFSKAVVRCRVPILIVTLLLMIPSVLGMAATRVNYDMLTYLPEDMDTVVGQEKLQEEFGKSAFTFLIFEGMEEKDVPDCHFPDYRAGGEEPEPALHPDCGD